MKPMIAEFFIVPESFSSNINLTKQEIEDKIKSLSDDFTYIRRHKEDNKLFVHPEIYDVEFLEGLSLTDLLFDPLVGKRYFDRDVYTALQKVVVETATTTFTCQEVIDVLLSEHNEDLCHGLIGFNFLKGVKPEIQIVYNLNGWLEFRRYYLGLYPKNETYFIEECKKYFPSLYFHERNKHSIAAILPDCPKKIIYHLAALNDIFNAFDKTNMNRTQVLTAFSALAKLDETASLEGNASRKADFTFVFENEHLKEEDVCCEPHLKLCYSDSSTSYSNDRRIYFHEGVSTIQKGKILIGHIGSHL